MRATPSLPPDFVGQVRDTYLIRSHLLAFSISYQEGGKFIPESDGDSDPDASRSIPSTPSDLSLTSGDALSRHEYIDHPIFEEGQSFVLVPPAHTIIHVTVLSCTV